MWIRDTPHVDKLSYLIVAQQLWHVAFESTLLMNVSFTNKKCLIISSCDFPTTAWTCFPSIYRDYGNWLCNTTCGGSVECFQEFLDETRKYYQADLQSVDFQAKAEEARVEINTWVEQQTQGGTQTHTCKHTHIRCVCVRVVLMFLVVL